MKEIRFRASSLGRIMADAQSIDPCFLTDELATISRKTKKTEEEKAILAPLKERSLSAGAKTYLYELAKETVYGYDKSISNKYMEKGITVELDSLALYNTVTFSNYEKNVERKTNDWITGECDIFTGDSVVDLKSAWNLDTFPAIASEGIDSGYEWQGRAYMWLWDVPRFSVAYCLVNTPEELIGYEDPELHIVDHIDPMMRVTQVHYERDASLEKKIEIKVIEARKYVDSIIRQIVLAHA